MRPVCELEGPSRTIIVEPLRTSQPREEPAPPPEPEPVPVREQDPEKVPA